jgi:cyclophilin family peptidyl-prolyl cis-trans isomerase
MDALLRCLLLLCSTLLGVIGAPTAHAACDLTGVPAGAEVAELETPLGSLCIELLGDDAPLHVQNFLFYLEGGLLEGSFFHRSVPGFVLQGGGFTLGASDFEAIPAQNGPVANEPCTLDTPDPLNPGGQICSLRGNERGSVALAKVAGNPSSGTTNWFVNLADNRSNLDNQNGGFSVFGRLVGGTLAVADAIAALPRASQDDLAWRESAFQGSSGFSIPLLEPPLATPFGCWDRAQEATALVAAQLGTSLQPWLDTILASFPMQVSAACGTPIPTPASSADLPPDSCPNPGGVAVRVTGPFTLLFPGGTPAFVSLSCAQVQESLDQRTLWHAAYKTHFDQQLLFVESATVHVAPPSVPSTSAPGGLLLAGLVLGAGARFLRRRGAP